MIHLPPSVKFDAGHFCPQFRCQAKLRLKSVTTRSVMVCTDIVGAYP